MFELFNLMNEYKFAGEKLHGTYVRTVRIGCYVNADSDISLHKYVARKKHKHVVILN